MSSKYNQIPAPRLFFQQLKGLHENTARSLIAKDLLDSQQFVAGIAARTARALPAALGALIEAQPPDEHSLSILLATELSLLQLGGDNGLKARTGLLEHRYDAV